MKWKPVLWVIIIVIPLLLLLFKGFELDPREVPSVMAGKPLPSCRLQTFSGQQFSLAKFVGKPLVINFWASWCVPCEVEHQVLQRGARTFAEQANFVGIVYQDEPMAAQQFIRQQGSSYENYLDVGSRCAMDLGVAGVPETFFVDAHGVVVSKYVGPLSSGELAMKMGELVAPGSRP